MKPGLTVVLGGSSCDRRRVTVSLLETGGSPRRWCFSRSATDDEDLCNLALSLRSVSDSLSGRVQRGDQVIFFCGGPRDFRVQSRALSFLSPICSTVLVVDCPSVQDDERMQSGLLRLGLRSSVDWGEFSLADRVVLVSPCEKLRRLARAMTGKLVPGGKLVIL